MSEKIRVLLSEEEVGKKIREIGEQISKDYEGKTVHLICVFGVLPVKRTMKNNKFFSVSLLTGWRYFYAAFNVSS